MQEIPDNRIVFARKIGPNFVIPTWRDSSSYVVTGFEDNKYIIQSLMWNGDLNSFKYRVSITYLINSGRDHIKRRELV